MVDEQMSDLFTEQFVYRRRHRRAISRREYFSFIHIIMFIYTILMNICININRIVISQILTWSMTEF